MGEEWLDWSWVVAAAATASIVVIIIINMRNRRRRTKDADRVPGGSWGWPLIGETLDFIASGYSSKPVSFMDKRKSLYGSVFRTHILGKAVIVSTDPDVNKHVLQNHGNAFIPSYPKSIKELFGESSILQMSGPLHKRVHGLIGGFLKSPSLKGRITENIENSVRASLSTWKDNNGQVYVQDETKKLTFEILVRVLLSVGPGEEMRFLKREFEEFIKGLICLPIKLPGTQLYKSLQAKKRLLQRVEKIIEERKLIMVKTQEKKELPNDAIDVLLRDSDELEEMLDHKLPPNFISGNIIEMMIPGEETVPTAMTLAVKFLGDHPIALAHLVEENMELKKSKEESCEEYSWMDYLSLPFTQNVISETLRLANIINAVWREAVKDVRVKGYLIPKGWCVLASLSSVHMNEAYYCNPYEFDPWRWKEVGVIASNNLFTPFGGGQRLCPGLELSRLEVSIFLHHLVTTYRWTAEKDDITYFPTVKMKRKLPITVMPLKQ
ncbi:3-epi-6-deoxocathasterone 23-monooxygenase CYP90C1 [Andrographis paniculata]|uniref:3-epi-6-deoxocathasterone 23-monooxygenase CYP90C1 n=1 Tax=Andrographis paniculata TaxID=175694 RepID=UPI0021E8DDA3|nr:3-epi-6-deoxocathasterone 23-monooxygenase CYP90C1 [Andrographis paniculata]XP_051120643.1 3-epi-6-deoxocathasterone 23-monooxygenase CYP90C1 [Andrographis paniculata]